MSEEAARSFTSETMCPLAQYQNHERQTHLLSTVFAIDDDTAILDALKYIVEELGFAYEPFSSTQAFWRARAPQKTGCLILDMGIWFK